MPVLRAVLPALPMCVRARPLRLPVYSMRLRLCHHVCHSAFANASVPVVPVAIGTHAAHAHDISISSTPSSMRCVVSRSNTTNTDSTQRQTLAWA